MEGLKKSVPTMATSSKTAGAAPSWLGTGARASPFTVGTGLGRGIALSPFRDLVSDDTPMPPPPPDNPGA